MPGTTPAGMPAAGDRDRGRSPGDGVPICDVVSENSSASERGLLGAEAREARAAAVAAAASSTVPV
jgi:hypothetical protein